MTIKEDLSKQLERDINRQKGTVKKDTKNHFLHYDETRRVFLGRDENSVEWIAGPDTDVPQYWVYCPNEINFYHKGEMKTRECGKPHIMPIYRDGEQWQCVECHNKFIIKIDLDPKSPQAKLLKQLKQE